MDQGYNRQNKKKKILAVVGIVSVAVIVSIVCLWGLFFREQKKQEAQRNSGKVQTDARESLPDQGDAADKQPDSGELSTEEPFKVVNPEGSTLKQRIRTPLGYQRSKADKDSLTAFLRKYPLKKAGKPVLLYNGEKKWNQDAHVAVFKLPLENEDLQQCADTVMRVYAEYFWKTKQKERISFHFVDGFQADYIRWQNGERIQVGESRTSWIAGGAYDASYENLKKYLRMVFAYASTLSLKQESKKIKLSDIDVGDIFLTPGSPGHVVMVVDVCEAENGKKAFLLGQGYMPAQEFHLLKNPEREEDPWYYEEEVSYPFVTPEHTFKKGSLRRLQY